MAAPKIAYAILLLFIAMVSCGMAQSTELRIVPVYFERPLLPFEVQLFCTERYVQRACLRDATQLHLALARYPVELLGEWSFVLLPAKDWQATITALGHREDTPAFSILDAHVTVLESSLFAPSPARRKQLFEKFGRSGEALLELAITHEIVHGVCMDKDERRVEADRERLRQSKRLECTRILAETAQSK